MTTLLLTLAVFALAMLIMAVGVIMRRPCLRGSCGGPEVLAPDGEPLTCATCPNRKRRGGEGERTAGASLPVLGARARQNDR